VTELDPLVGVRNHTTHRLSLVENIWRRLQDFAGENRTSFLELIKSVQHPATDVPMWAAQSILNAGFAEGWDPGSGQLQINDDVRSIVGSSIDHSEAPGTLIYPERPGAARSLSQFPPAGRAFTWDWKEQPPMEEIGKAVAEMSEDGPVYFTQVEDGTDAYVWVISNQELTGAEALEVVEAGTCTPEDLA
jgi:hypothetical protein